MTTYKSFDAFPSSFFDVMKRRISLRNVILWSSGFLFLSMTFYTGSMLWRLHYQPINHNGHNIIRIPSTHPLSSSIGLQKIQKDIKTNLFPRPLFNNNEINVLILIASVPRTPETICTTLHSIWDNFSDSSYSENVVHLDGNVSRNNATIIHPPVVLLHRYGPWPCPNVDKEDPFPHQGRLLLREFPPHSKISNMQQIQDFLDLMNDALQVMISQRHPTPPVSHVMFLDDDVELCYHFSHILPLIQQQVPNITLAHLGRGGSGVLIHSRDLHELREIVRRPTDQKKNQLSLQMQNNIHHGTKQRRTKNIDKSLLEWALHVRQGCTVRPTTIQMRHVGLQSRLHLGQTWEDVDRCGGAANNRAWQSLSERQFHPSFFNEYCVLPKCSPYTSMMTASTTPTICQCLPGYMGSDCGIPIDSAVQYDRRNVVAPIVVLLSASSDVDEGSLTRQVLADSSAHNLVNLYILGNYSLRHWLRDNVYTSPSDPYHALKIELQNSSQFGEVAFPEELVILEKLQSPQKLWTTKYYTKR